MISRKVNSIVLFVQLILWHSLPAQKWHALYAFGDSYTDSGAGYLDGNGPTAVVYLAAALGIPFTYAGDSNPSDKSLNFAVSGARTGSGEGYRIRPASARCEHQEALLGRGMLNQVLDFTVRVKSGGIRFNPNTTLFFLAGGLNDGTVPTATTIANLENEIRQLYDVGGRYFMVALLPTKIPALGAIGKRLNPALTKIPEDLEATLPGARIVLSKWGEYFDNVLDNPSRYGITNVSESCAGRALFGEDATPCASPNAYFFFHEGHPSTAVQQIVAQQLEREVAESFPANSSDANLERSTEKHP